jgi:hypothetical protein
MTVNAADQERLVTLGIVGGGKGGSEILRLLSEIASFRIMYIVDINPDAEAFRKARNMGITVSTNIELTVKSNRTDFIIEATGSRKVFETIRGFAHEYTEILSSKAALLIFNMLEENRTRINSGVTGDIVAIRAEIVSDTKRVNEFLKNINDITLGMKILALNASVEAARSGVNGKGFAVVAGEIKSLSERTRALAQSIDTINSSIAEMSTRIDESREKLK